MKKAADKSREVALHACQESIDFVRIGSGGGDVEGGTLVVGCVCCGRLESVVGGCKVSDCSCL